MRTADRINATAALAHFVAFSPDGVQVASAGYDGRVMTNPADVKLADFRG